MRKIQIAGLVLALGSVGCIGTNHSAAKVKAAQLNGPWVVSNVGFATPESVLYDDISDVYLVSNINGSCTERDGNGFISRLMPDGTVANLKWVDGENGETTLNAPKGMALVGNILYVADIDHVRMFHRHSGASLGEIAILEATFLNDVAPTGEGGVLVSDSGLTPDFASSGTDTIYSIDADGVVTTLVSGTELARPNGLAVFGGAVWNVSFGSKEVRKMDFSGALLESYQAPAGSLDGIEILPDGSALISSWASKSVYQLKPDGTFHAVVTEVEAAADIGVDTRRNRILVPLFKAHAVHIEPLS